MGKIILYSIGVINLALGIFHLFFWKLFNWAEELPKISPENQGILQIANIILIFIILYFAVMSVAMAKQERLELFGKSILIMMSGFYFIRLVTGYIFFGFSLTELIISIICSAIITGNLFIIIDSGRGPRTPV